MDYLLDGKYTLAAAAALTLQRLRGFERPRDWTSESYEQLLVGYALALANEMRSLRAWLCLTAASRNLGTDGLILTAHLRWLERDHAAALEALKAAAAGPPPAVSFAVVLGLALTDRYLGMLDGATEVNKGHGDEGHLLPIVQASSPSLVALRRSLMRIAVDTAPFAGTVSLPRTRLAAVTDSSRLPWHDRVAWWLRYWLTRWRFRYGSSSLAVLPDLIDRITKGEEMAQTRSESRLSGPPLYVAIGAVAIWLVFTVFMLTKTGSNEVTWSRAAWIFASVQAVAFAAVGALFGTTVQRDRAEQAENRATEAEKIADENRDAAARGRALAADVQARLKAEEEGARDGSTAMRAGGEGPEDTTLRDLAEVSRSLFGELV